MGTEILRAQDCLIERVRESPCRRRNYYGGNFNPTFYHSSSSSSSSNYFNPRSNRKPAAVQRKQQQQQQRQPEPGISKRSGSVDDLKIARSHTHQHHQHHQQPRHGRHHSQSLVMEKVMILRRGESLDSKIRSGETPPSRKEQVAASVGGEMVVTGTDRLGPDPGMVPKQIRIVDLRSPVAGNSDVYAGSAFSVSPAPSSLPLPSFSKKKQLSVDDSATRDLRRLLRLDF